MVFLKTKGNCNGDELKLVEKYYTYISSFAILVVTVFLFFCT